MIKKSSQRNLINTLLRATIESAPQPPMFAELYDKHLISQFHTMIVIPFGLGKTSKAEEIPNSHLLYNYSFAGLIGTINKEGELVESGIQSARKKVLVVDEGHRLKETSRDALLNLLSNGFYSRSLGYKARGFQKTIGSRAQGFVIKPNKSQNGFAMWARFSCLYFCERIPDKLKYAFLSRFIPVVLETELDDVYDFAEGKNILGSKFEPFKFRIYKDNEPCIIPKDVHLQFIEEHKKIIMSFANEKIRRFSKKTGKSYERKMFDGDEGGYVSRNIINLVKLACHFARMDNRTTVQWRDFERVIPLIRPTIRFTLLTRLTPIQMRVFNLLDYGMTQIEIAKELGLSKSTVNEHVERLSKKGVIE